MVCSRPYVNPGGSYGCGQCLPCRINRRRIWASRLTLEAAACNFEGMFLTLTYDDEHLPPDGNLVPQDAKNFLKRYRHHLGEQKIRFYLVGEYGKLTKRPHYHVMVFGHKMESGRYAKNAPGWNPVSAAWKLGGFHVSELNKKTIDYGTKHVVKGHSATHQNGAGFPTVQQFARMSNRPPIGAGCIERIAKLMTTKEGAQLIAELQDVPDTVSMDGREYVLGRTLRKKLRLACGFPDDKQPMMARLLQQYHSGEFEPAEVSQPLKVQARKRSQLDAEHQAASFYYSEQI